MDRRDWRGRDISDRCLAINIPDGGDCLLWCHQEQDHPEKHVARFGTNRYGVTTSRHWSDDSPNHYIAQHPEVVAALVLPAHSGDSED